MVAKFDWSKISFHDNSMLEFRFIPESAELRIIMEDPIEGGTGKRSLRLLGVQSVSISGSTTAGASGFIAGDEVLSVDVHSSNQQGVECLRVRFLLNPVPTLTRQAVGLNVVEVVAWGAELVE